MNKSNRFRFLVLSMLFAFSLVMSSCTTTESGVEAREAVRIEKGMSAEDLVEVLGPPSEIRPATPVVEGTEIWVYRKVSENVALVLSGTVETPGINPITGMESPIIDNVYTPETSRVKQETLFLMVNGVMTAWKVQRDEAVRLN